MEDKEEMDEDTTIVAETPPEELESGKTPDNAAESVLGIMMMFLDGEVRISKYSFIILKPMLHGQHSISIIELLF